MLNEPFAKFMFEVKKQLDSELLNAGIRIPEGHSSKGGREYHTPSKGLTPPSRLTIPYHMKCFLFWYKNNPYWKPNCCHVEASLCLLDSTNAGQMFVSLSCDTIHSPPVRTWPHVVAYFQSLQNKN